MDSCTVVTKCSFLWPQEWEGYALFSKSHHKWMSFVVCNIEHNYIQTIQYQAYIITCHGGF